MILRKITYRDYRAKHDMFDIPTAGGGPVSEDEWNKLYGGDVMLPYANALPSGYRIKDGQILDADDKPAVSVVEIEGEEVEVPANGAWSFEEMDGDQAEKAIAATQEKMQAILKSADDLDGNIKPHPDNGGGGDGGGGDGGITPAPGYVVQQFQDNGFFNENQMNGQIQVFNTTREPGPEEWALVFTSNYALTKVAVTGASAGDAVVDDLGDTYRHVIPMKGALPGNNGNAQVAIEGTRHPKSTDTQASHAEEGVFV